MEKKSFIFKKREFRGKYNASPPLNKLIIVLSLRTIKCRSGSTTRGIMKLCTIDHCCEVSVSKKHEMIMKENFYIVIKRHSKCDCDRLAALEGTLAISRSNHRN